VAPGVDAGVGVAQGIVVLVAGDLPFPIGHLGEVALNQGVSQLEITKVITKGSASLILAQ